MATTRRRIQLTFRDDGPLVALGIDPVSDGATEVWPILALLGHAVGRARRRLQRRLSPAERGLLAEALQGRSNPADYLESTAPLSAQVADEILFAQEALALGDDWLGEDRGDEWVARLARRLRAMGPAEALAILAIAREPRGSNSTAQPAVQASTTGTVDRRQGSAIDHYGQKFLKDQLARMLEIDGKPC